MGAEAVRKALEKVDLNKQAISSGDDAETKSKQIRKKLAKRIKLLQGLEFQRAVRSG